MWYASGMSETKESNKKLFQANMVDLNFTWEL